MAGEDDTVRVRLVADVNEFIRGWTEAAAAAERAAAQIRAAERAAAQNDPDRGRSRNRERAEVEAYAEAARRAARETRELEDASSSLGDKFGSLGARSQVMVVALGLLASLAPAIAAAMFSLGAAATGVGIAAGVAALGSKGLGQAFDRLQAAIKPLQSALDSVFRQQAGPAFREIGQALASMTPEFKGVASAIADVIKYTAEWIKSAEGTNTIKTALGGVRDLVEHLAPAVQGVVKVFATFAADAAPSMAKIGDALSYVVGLWQQAIDEASKSGDLGKAFDAGASAIKGFGDILKGVFDILVQVAAQGGPAAADALSSIGKALSDAAPAIAAVLTAMAQFLDIVMKIVGPIATLVGWIGKLVGAFDAFNPDATIKNFGELQKSMSGTGSAAQGAAQGVAQATGQMKGSFDGLGQSGKSATDKLWSGVTQSTAQGRIAVLREQTGLKTLQKQMFDQQVQAGAKPTKELWDQVVAQTTSGVQDTSDAMGELPDQSKQTMDGWKGDLQKAGKDAMDGLTEGTKSGIGELVATMVQAGVQALAALKDSLGIKSPSTVFADEVGRHIPSGIAAGITGNQRIIADALRLATSPAALGDGLAGSATQAARGLALGGSSGRGAPTGPVVVELRFAGSSDTAIATMFNHLQRTGKIQAVPR